MSYTKQGERFGRVTGHTLRRSPQSNLYTGQFVLMKKAHRIDPSSYDSCNGQFQELLSDGDLQGSDNMVYSLNKRKRWELPGLLKDSICNDGDTHEDLDFKVLLVENHLDSRGVFKPACTGLYESKTTRPERLPKKKYAHARDLHRSDRSGAQAEALRSQINKIRCAKNRGGKKINWRAVMDAMQERIQEEQQRQEEEEENMPQLRFEVGYGRPENKYPWRPEMKMNTATSSKRAMGTKQRSKGNTSYYLQDAYEVMDEDIQDDIFEDVRSHSEAESLLWQDAVDSGLLVCDENRPMVTLGEALCGLAKKPKQSKKQRRNKSNSTSAQPTKGALNSNQATSDPVKVQDKGSVVYDPDAVIYKPREKRQRRGKQQKGKGVSPGTAATSRQEESIDRALPSVHLAVDDESLEPSRLEADFGSAYTKGECIPQKFAIEVSEGDEDSSSDPSNSVFALFEYLKDDSTTIECTASKDAESWEIVKNKVHVRMTLYGQKHIEHISSENLAATFPSADIISVQEVMRRLQSELQKSATFWNTCRTQKRVKRPKARCTSVDIPTVRAALGWDCRISSADEAYRDLTSRQTPEPGSHGEVQDLAVGSSTCGICYENLSPPATDGASGAAPSADGLESTTLTWCGHCFCNSCWCQYLRSGVKQGAANFTCPEYNCKTPVDPVTAMSFVSPAQFHTHYRRARDVTLACSAGCHVCPDPHCGRIARMDCTAELASEDRDRAKMGNDVAAVVRCECGWLWCTECREQAHWPASCRQAKDYRTQVKRRFGEKETPLITHVHVKHCPACKTRWEKNGGCPWMVCGMCGFTFCWLCLRDYEAHNNQGCSKSTVSLKAIHLDYSTATKDGMLELAMEHHKQRLWSMRRRNWFAAAKLASRSAMAQIAYQRSASSHVSLLKFLGFVMATASCASHKQLTWDRARECLEIMHRRAEESYEIAVFCHEVHFVLEHLAFLLGSLPRRQRKATWWRAMLMLRFIVKGLEETLANLPNVKRSELEATMDRLCNMMHAGKECLRRLAMSMPSTAPEGHSIKE